jgi:ribose 5-phosphate isomerase B
MNIYIGADHNGYELKVKLRSFLVRSGFEVVDEGDTQQQPDDDFPQFAGRVCTALLDNGDTEARGILICGSGQGMCMAANRFKGIRASLCWNNREARSSRNDDDSNVLCLSASSLDEATMQNIVQTWLGTPFAGAARFKRRLLELDKLG